MLSLLCRVLLEGQNLDYCLTTFFRLPITIKMLSKDWEIQQPWNWDPNFDLQVYIRLFFFFFQAQNAISEYFFYFTHPMEYFYERGIISDSVKAVAVIT